MLLNGLAVFCSETRLGPGPRQQGRQVQAVWKRALNEGRPQARRKRIPGAARSVFHQLARARDGVPQRVWLPIQAQDAPIYFSSVDSIGQLSGPVTDRGGHHGDR